MGTTVWFPPQRIFPWQFDAALPEPARPPEETPGPQLMPDRPAQKPPRFPLWAAGLMLALGAAVGAALWSALESGAETAQVAAGPVETVRVEKVNEVNRLINRLKERGVAMILVSHRFTDLIQVADTIGVLVHGRIVDEFEVADQTTDEMTTRIVRLMGEADAGVPQ